MRRIRYSALVCCLAVSAGLDDGPCRRDAVAASPSSPDASNLDTAEPLARHCMTLADASSGVCAVFGCGDGQLPLAIAEAHGYFVYAQDPNESAVDEARRGAEHAGVYGKQIVIERGNLNRSPLASGMVDLVLAVELDVEELKSLSAEEFLRVLRPGGVAIIGRANRGRSGDATAMTKDQLADWLAAAKVNGATTVSDAFGVWARFTKPAQQGVDNWSHWEHGPDNNPVSTDQVIEAPYATQWLGLPQYIAMPAITTSAGGRLFIAMGHIAHHRREEPWLNTLLARNAYNGAVLWTRKLPDGYLVHRSAFIATDDVFYLIDPGGTGCLMLDAETGDELGRIAKPAKRNEELKWMAMLDGVLYVLSGEKKGATETTVVRSETPHWSWGELSKGYYTKRVPWGFGSTITAIDLATHETLWTRSEDAPIDSRAMVMGGGRLYYYCPDKLLACLDARTGEPIWTNENADTRELIEEEGRGLSSTPGFRSACFSLYTPNAIIYEAQTHMNVVAVSAKTGSMLWKRKKTTSNPNIIFTDDRIYAGVGDDGNTLALDPVTGEVLADLGFKKRSCARLTATPDSFFCRGFPEGLTRYDRKTGEVFFNGAFRPSCNDGVIPANGLLYLGPWACDCNLSVMGRVALCSASQVETLSVSTSPLRPETGGGDGASAEPLGAANDDWSTYRGNVKRNASSTASAGGALSEIWTYMPPTEFRPTAPTAAGGLVFYGGDDGVVRAIDASTGKRVWTYPTAGPIAQPPTIANDRAYVGSGDGCVYALEAKTGRLLWRNRVAPRDRRIMVYGALSSTWPVNSGVLVQDGVAYAAAGIVDYDGTYVAAFDALTGEVKWLNDATGHLDPALRKGVSAQGTLTLAGGKLWLAGGNVVSPAAFDIATGEYLSGQPGDGSPRANRGEEVAAFRDRFVMLGGRLKYSAVRNVVDPGTFAAHRIDESGIPGPPKNLNIGKIAPSWDDELVVFVNGRDAPPEGYDADALEAFLDSPDQKLRSNPIWVAEALRGSDTVSIAMAKDAIFAVCSTPQFRKIEPEWRIVSINRGDGAILSQYELPGEALPSGLLIDSAGRAIVVLHDGGVACVGGPRALDLCVRAATENASKSDDDRAFAVEFLRSALKNTQSSDARELIRKSLASLGERALDRAAMNGYITEWKLIGRFPWDDRNDVDAIQIDEPDIDLSKTYSATDGDASWREFVTGDEQGEVNLAKIFGPSNDAAAYGYAEFMLSSDAPLKLMIGSNDGFKCWLNGDVVGQFDGGRSYVPDQDALSVNGKKGVNRVLIKVTQMGGSWAFGVRVLDHDANPIDVSAE